MKKILSLIAVVIIVIVIVYWWSVSHFLPELSDSGLFGDSFGALNALFSGIALIGVVCALYIQQRQLYLQKKDSEKNLSLVRTQLEEMQKSFQLQYQPVLQFHPQKLVINKPSLFNSPDDEGCYALSRYNLFFELRNVSESPAIDGIVSAMLNAVTDSTKEELTTTSSHFPVITKDSVAEDHMLFVPDKPFVTLFEVLRDQEDSRIPTINVAVLYKNLMEGCFIIRQAFHVFLKSEDSDLVNWQNAIASFPVTYKSELRDLKDFEKEPSRWHEHFDDIKSNFARRVEGPDEIELTVLFIPGYHEAKHISDSEYANLISKIGFPRRTFAHTKCPITKEEE